MSAKFNFQITLGDKFDYGYGHDNTLFMLVNAKIQAKKYNEFGKILAYVRQRLSEHLIDQVTKEVSSTLPKRMIMGLNIDESGWVKNGN